MNTLTTATLWFWRGFKRGEWLWLWVAVVIASSSVVLVEQLAYTVHQSMLAKAAEALKADLLIRSSRPIDEQLRQKAHKEGVKTAESIHLTTMLMANDDFQLVRLIAQSPEAPLRGELSPGLSLKQLSPNQLFADPQLQTLLNIDQHTPIYLGNDTFTVADWLNPNDALFTSFSAFAPSVMMPLERLRQLDLIGPGSRLTYELSFAGEPSTILQWHQYLEQHKQPHWQILNARAPNQDLERSLDTAWTFLDLSALSSVLIAGLAILIASRFYLQRWIASMALMRAVGSSDRQLQALFAIQLTWLALLGSMIGGLLGIGIFQLITPWLEHYFEPLVQPNPIRALLLGLACGTLTLWTFAWPAFRQATRVSPQQVFRDTRPPLNPLIALVTSLVLLVGLMALLLTGKVVIWAIPTLLIAAALFYLLAIGLLTAIKQLQPLSQGWLRLALAALAREPGLVKLQLVALGLVIFMLVLMGFVRQDLIESWLASLPEDTPNVFMLNIQPDQQKTVTELLSNQGVTSELVPVVRGRITSVNGKPIRAEDFDTPRAKRLLLREANVSLLDHIPNHNPLVAEITPQQRLPKIQPVSVEEGIAKLLRLKIGDVLTFDFIGNQRNYQITSLRKVVWQSFRLNFFFIIHQESPKELPISYITNFRSEIPTEQSGAFRRQLQEQAPGVVWIDTQGMLTRVQQIMDQASMAVGMLYLFTLVSSIIVLFTATRAAQQGRLRSWLLLRTLGAEQNDIIRIGMTEFALIGLLAGLFAALLAQVTSLLISHFWLDLTPQLNPQLWLISIVISVGLLLMIGWLTQRGALRLSPKGLMRQIERSY